VKTGAEPKKIAILAGLLIAAGVVLYINVFSGADSGAPVSPASRTVAGSSPAPVPLPSGVSAGRERPRSSRTASLSEFKIRLGVAPGQDKPDPATIDPTLRLDLLAKVQNVQPEGAMRNLFQFGAAPPPPAAKPVELPKNTPKIPINQPGAAGPSGPAPPPQAPPITFKYYGYKVSKADGRKEAFLLDGDEIIIAGENESVKRGRYKVVRIGVNSITMEDTQFKSTQTLQMQEEAAA
jgi:hypothetical protein